MADTNETFLNPSRRQYNYDNSRTSGNKARIIFIVLGIVVLIGLIIFAAVATGGKGEQEITATPTQSFPTDTPIPTEEPSPTPNAKVTPTKAPKVSPTPGKTTPTPGKGTPTPTGASSVDKASGLDRADLKVAIQNGSGVAGAATKASSLLKKLGYDVVSSGNADNFDYEGTTIQVKTTKKAYLDILKKDLAEEYTIDTATSNYTGDEADAVVIIGK